MRAMDREWPKAQKRTFGYFLGILPAITVPL